MIGIIMQRTKAFVEGRAPDDPTVDLDEETREYVRAEARNHLLRNEQNRVARVNASRHIAGRSCDGELVDAASLTGVAATERRLADCWPPRWID